MEVGRSAKIVVHCIDLIIFTIIYRMVITVSIVDQINTIYSVFIKEIYVANATVVSAKAICVYNTCQNKFALNIFHDSSTYIILLTSSVAIYTSPLLVSPY